MGKRAVSHMAFEDLVGVNREVVVLTGEAHAYSEPDGEKIAALADEVKTRGNDKDYGEAVPDKASLLMFKLASGQYFRAGNKRTAIVAGDAFLRKNGYVMDIADTALVAALDKAGVGAATLDDVYSEVERLSSKSKVARKGWAGVVKEVVDANKDFLTNLAS